MSSTALLANFLQRLAGALAGPAGDRTLYHLLFGLVSFNVFDVTNFDLSNNDKPWPSQPMTPSPNDRAKFRSM